MERIAGPYLREGDGAQPVNLRQRNASELLDESLSRSVFVRLVPSVLGWPRVGPDFTIG